MKKPSKKTIERICVEKTIKRLKEMQPKVRHHSVFGDDNRAAIAAQIDVLENNLDEDEIDKEYNCAGDSEYVYNAAQDARQWLDGEVEGNLADDWENLVEDREEKQ